MSKALTDPFSLEAQLARLREGMKPTPAQTASNKLANRYADAIDKLQRKEAKMRRAFTAWDSQRAVVARLNKQLDKLE